MAVSQKNGTLTTYRVGELEKWKPKVERHIEATDHSVEDLNKFRVQTEADVTQLSESMKTMVKQQTSINNWLRGIFGSLFVALILLIFDLMKHTL